jgi:hypothetical protein
MSGCTFFDRPDCSELEPTDGHTVEPARTVNPRIARLANTSRWKPGWNGVIPVVLLVAAFKLSDYYPQRVRARLQETE